MIVETDHWLVPVQIPLLRVIMQSDKSQNAVELTRSTYLLGALYFFIVPKNNIATLNIGLHLTKVRIFKHLPWCFQVNNIMATNIDSTKQWQPGVHLNFPANNAMLLLA